MEFDTEDQVFDWLVKSIRQVIDENMEIFASDTKDKAHTMLKVLRGKVVWGC